MKKVFITILAVVIGVPLLAALILFIIPLTENNKVDTNASACETLADGTGWMSRIDDEIYLSEINIPGTHDSATQYSQLAFFSKCQGMNILEQLKAGFRYLDIRLEAVSVKDTSVQSYDGMALQFVHGFTKCRTGVFPWDKTLYLDRVLADCYSFLENHCSETIIFCVKKDHGDTSISDFEKLLNCYIEENPERWYTANEIPTMEDARGKIVLARRYSDEANLGDKAGLSLVWNEQGGSEDTSLSFEYNDNEGKPLYVQDRYEFEIDEKMASFMKSITQSPACAEVGTINIAFLSTKGGSAVGHPYQYASMLNKKFVQNEYEINQKYGWLIFDFANDYIAEKVYLTNR